MALGRDEWPMALRYGMRHTWRCECSDCLTSYQRHVFKYGNCACVDCANTRLWADQKADKAARDNLAPKSETERVNTVATVNFCERHTCETMAKSPAMGMLVIIPVTAGPENIYADAVHTTDRNTIRMELCPGCVGELMEWVDAMPLSERPKAYSKPWKREDKPATSPENMGSSELFRLALEASKREMESGEVPEA